MRSQEPAEAQGSVDYQPALDVAIEAARDAGALLRDDFLKTGGPSGEGDHAEADEPAEILIRGRLLAATPRWGFRGEETRPHLTAEADETGHRHVWLVDPNDGTTAYLQGWRGSAVSIGLLRDGQPVLGVVFAFAAPDNEGDLFAWAEGCGPMTRNGVAVDRSHEVERENIQYVLVSQAADRAPEENLAILNRYLTVTSIAYRLPLVAVGEGDGSICLSHPGDYDYGGGHALLRSAGGDLVDQDGSPVTYRPDDGASRTTWCFGGVGEVARRLAGLPWQSVVDAQTEETDYDLCRPVRGETIADNGLLRRGQGCWLGQLCGDVLGSVVEFSSAEVIRRRYPGGLRAIGPSPVWQTIAGQPTDDSELALLLGRTLVRDGTYSDENAAASYVFWRESEPFDIGNTIRVAIDAMCRAQRQGTSLAEARSHANVASEANGAMMRQSPLAIWGHAMASSILAEVVNADTALTHPNQVCREASAAYAVALAATIRDGLDGPAAYETACEWHARHGKSRSVTEALARARHAAPNCETNAGHVIVALQNAFYQALHAPSFEEGIVSTVMAGGDTDTNGAIAGALLGAIHGASAVPDQWRRAVLSCRPQKGIAGIQQPRPRAFWPVDALVLSERLLVAGQRNDHPYKS
jgi:ADP-ribosyl-[dinitrogen reductase] hydrolase